MKKIKLKTLKELIEKADKGNGLVTTIGIKKMLRAEAVKWIKKMREDKNAERLKDNSYFVGLNLSETKNF